MVLELRRCNLSCEAGSAICWRSLSSCYLVSCVSVYVCGSQSEGSFCSGSLLAVVMWMCLARAMCASLQAWYIIGGSHVTKNVGCYISVISLFV
jgi:hypothetical protein